MRALSAALLVIAVWHGRVQRFLDQRENRWQAGGDPQLLQVRVLTGDGQDTGPQALGAGVGFYPGPDDNRSDRSVHS